VGLPRVASRSTRQGGLMGAVEYADFHVTAATLSPALFVSALVLTRWMAQAVEGAPRLSAVMSGGAALVGYAFLLTTLGVMLWNLAVLMGGMRSTFDGRLMTLGGLALLTAYSAFGAFFGAHPPRLRTYGGGGGRDAGRLSAPDDRAGSSALPGEERREDPPGADADSSACRRRRVTRASALLLGATALAGGVTIGRRMGRR
jgi:hypothetical protein